MGRRGERLDRAERPIRCNKRDFGSFCVDVCGVEVDYCHEAAPLNDSAHILGEFVCPRMIDRSVNLSMTDPESPDSYPQRYFAVGAKIVRTLADTTLDMNAVNQHFRSHQQELTNMIRHPQFHDNGDYIFHIDARMIQSSLRAFWYRAEHGYDASMPRDIIADSLRQDALLLRDFDRFYDGHAHQVGNKRTEVEIKMLTNYIALQDPRYFAFAALPHEDGSRTRAHNHDLNILCGDPDLPSQVRKVSLQVKTADYRDRGARDGRRISRRYANSPNTVVVIHDDIVNLQTSDRSRFRRQRADDYSDHPYAHHDPDNRGRYISWGAFQTEIGGQLSDEALDLYDRMSNSDRKALLTRSLVKLGTNQKLNLLEREFLNDRARHLQRAIRQKMSN